MYRNYLPTGKDPNLNGAYLVLWDHAEHVCGAHSDALKASDAQDWEWNGPEVAREYPPDREIEDIQPDTKGLRYWQELCCARQSLERGEEMNG